MTNDRISSLVVLGGGSAGLLSALTCKLLMPDLSVTVLHSSDVPKIGVGESTTASIPDFLHNDLQLDRAELHRAVNPSWKLGIRFLWGAAPDSEFHYPFRSQCECPDIFSPSNAHYGLADYSQASLFSELMSRRLSALLRTPEGRTHVDNNFGYHLETERFAAYLEDVARKQGVVFVDCLVDSVKRSDSQHVEALVLSDGRSITADFFIDSSGFGSQLLGQSLEEPFVSYADSLFCDRAVVGAWIRDDPILPFTTAKTMRHGWCWRIDLPDKVSRGYVYSSQFCGDDEAAEEFLACDSRLERDSLRIIRFRSGRFERFWVGNVAAVGNAAGFVEPLESTGLHMAMETITALCRAIIDTDRQVIHGMQKLANQFVGEMWDDIRGFLATHFRFNRRMASPFWDHCHRHTDLAGATEVVDFYQNVGPSRIAHALLPSQSVFGLRGYVEMLRGMEVPTTFAFQPTNHQKAAWNQHLQQVGQLASCAMRMEQALQAMR